MQMGSLGRIEPLLVVLVLPATATVRRTLVHLPCLIIANALTFELKRVWDTLIVFDKATGGNWSSKLRHIFCRIESRLLLQIQIY